MTSDDANAALLRFSSGASGVITVSGASRVQRQIYEAHGSDGSLLIDQNQLHAGREPGKLERVEVPTAEGQGTVPLMVAYLSHVARVFSGEADPEVATFQQGLRVQAVMDAIHASSAAGGTRVAVGR